MEYIIKTLQPKRIDEKIAERGVVPVNPEGVNIEKMQLAQV
jgi:S-adenosylmethionine decarboxylase